MAEMLTSLALILQRYSVSMDSNYGEMHTVAAITAEPKKKLMVQFTKLNKD
jgi:hypothetical protein